MTPEQRALRSRLGGLTTASRHDAREITAPARVAFAARFYDGIPADLPQTERDRRAAAAKRLYFGRLALKSSQARSKKKAGPDRDSGPARSSEDTADVSSTA